MSDLFMRSIEIPAEQRAIRDKCFHPTGTFIEFDKTAIEPYPAVLKSRSAATPAGWPLRPEITRSPTTN